MLKMISNTGICLELVYNSTCICFQIKKIDLQAFLKLSCNEKCHLKTWQVMDFVQRGTSICLCHLACRGQLYFVFLLGRIGLINRIVC